MISEEYAGFNSFKLGYHVFTVKGRVKNPDYPIKKGNRITLVGVGGKSKDTNRLCG